jgi:hypothetical protein
MALSIDGTGNGSLNNLALSANTGTIVDTARAGGIIQVVQGTTTTQVTVSTTTYTDTGVTASITPTSSSNKILVNAVLFINPRRSTLEYGAGFRLLRDSTTILDPAANATGPFSIYTVASSSGTTFFQVYMNHPMMILDSPSSTSSLTYKVQMRPFNTANSGDVRINPAGSSGSPTSYITLMEVVA